MCRSLLIAPRRSPASCVHAVQQAGQLLLPRLRQQEVIERLERLALVRAGDGLPAAEHVVEQFALAAVPAGDLLPQLAVQLAEVLLHLAEVGQQLPRGGRRTAGSGRDRALASSRSISPASIRAICASISGAAGAARPAVLRVGLGAEDDLPKQVEDRVQPRLGAHELAFCAGCRPTAAPSPPREWRRSGARRCLPGSTCAASRPPARPSRPGRPSPAWGTWRRLAAALVQRVQLVVQTAGQFGRGDRPDVVGDEHLMQEAQHQRRVVRAQQPPRRAVIAQPGDLVKAHHAGREAYICHGGPW